MQTSEHWERVYATKSADTVSWYQRRASLSLDLIGRSGIAAGARIIDVGGGASPLAGDLLAAGYTDVTVLDVSARALAGAAARLGAHAERVTWIESDLLAYAWPEHAYDLWHDRAVFHFLTAPGARRTYQQAVLRALRPGGCMVVATFAEDGPEHCSGLPVVRYAPNELHACFGRNFELLAHEREVHWTPAGREQPFTWCLFRRTLAP